MATFTLKTRIAIAVLFLGISTTSAHAYLDPGTGSMILQLLLGGVAGAAVVAKLYWYKLLSFFGIRSRSDKTAEIKRDRNSGKVDARAK